MLNNEFKKSAIEKVTAMSANEYKEAFKAIGSLQTNEEWLRSCTTEQLIEFLEKITDPHVGYLDGYWQKWLKQPHTLKE